MNKRGQITIFIILGIVLVIGASFFYYIQSKETSFGDDLSSLTVQVPIEFQDIQDYVETCMLQVGEDAIIRLGLGGGYIDPISAGMNVFGEATDVDALKYNPGGELYIPYWYHLKSSNDCKKNCRFELQIPSLHRITGTDADFSIEAQLDRYVNQNLKACLDDFKPFVDNGFKFNQKGEIKTTTTVLDGEVEFFVEYPFRAEKLASHEFDKFLVRMPISLKKLYQQAFALTDMERQFNYYEHLLAVLIAAFSGLDEDRLPPMADVDFTFGSSKVWMKSDAKGIVKDLLVQYIPLMQVYGSKNYRYRNSADPFEEAYYNQYLGIPSNSSFSDLEVYFDYYDWWPIYYDMNCNGEVCMGSGIASDMMPFIGINKYKFYYDVSFPVLITIKDSEAFYGRGFTFQFFIEANMRNNAPMASFNESIDLEEELSMPSRFCYQTSKNSGNISFNVLNSVTGQPIDDVQIFYSCADENCFMGDTDNGAYEEQFPICLGGVVTLMKKDQDDEYMTKSIYLDTKLDEDRSFDIELEPFIELEYDVRKRLVEKKDTAVGMKWVPTLIDEPMTGNDRVFLVMQRISEFDEENYQVFATIPANTSLFENDEARIPDKLKLVPGDYNLKVQTLYYGNISIRDKVCWKEGGVMGIGEKKKCENLNFDFNETTPFGAGGVDINFTIRPQDLLKDKIIFSYMFFDLPNAVPKKFEDISAGSPDSMKNITVSKYDSLRPYFG